MHFFKLHETSNDFVKIDKSIKAELFWPDINNEKNTQTKIVKNEIVSGL